MDVDTAGTVKLYGRLGQRFKETMPQLANLPYPKPFFLDGELMRNGNIACWDAAVWGGEEVWHCEYIDRYSKLRSHLNASVNIEGFITVPSNAPEHYRSFVGSDVEGYVFKNLRATNLWGPTSTSEVNGCFKFRFK
jgi:hypothetical protein